MCIQIHIPANPYVLHTNSIQGAELNCLLPVCVAWQHKSKACLADSKQRKKYGWVHGTTDPHFWFKEYVYSE